MISGTGSRSTRNVRALPVVYAKQEPLPTAATRRAQLGF
jgi:hypothetical protein